VGKSYDAVSPRDTHTVPSTQGFSERRDPLRRVPVAPWNFSLSSEAVKAREEFRRFCSRPARHPPRLSSGTGTRTKKAGGVRQTPVIGIEFSSSEVLMEDRSRFCSLIMLRRADHFLRWNKSLPRAASFNMAHELFSLVFTIASGPEIFFEFMCFPSVVRVEGGADERNPPFVNRLGPNR